LSLGPGGRKERWGNAWGNTRFERGRPTALEMGFRSTYVRRRQAEIAAPAAVERPGARHRRQSFDARETVPSRPFPGWHRGCSFGARPEGRARPLAANLRAHLATQPDEDSTAFAFLNENGEALDPNNLRRRVLKPLVEEVSAPWAGFHTFRHTFLAPPQPKHEPPPAKPRPRPPLARLHADPLHPPFARRRGAGLGLGRHVGRRPRNSGSMTRDVSFLATQPRLAPREPLRESPAAPTLERSRTRAR